jgi:LytS/YehU family sensor histidine kinase
VQYLVVYGGAPVRPPFASFLPEGVRQNVLPWIAATGIVAAVEARRRAQQSALERERLRAQVAEQRLIALTGQLHPHFLFNTLQSISTLIHRDKDAADEMLAKLSDLLRDLLRHRDSALVSLGDEVRYARTYLEIAKVRFGDRLSFALEVPQELLECQVPLFILQPLVENALAHGVGGRMRGGRITLRASRRDETLSLEVADDGAGLPSAPRDGLGLSNTRERLRASFGDEQRFTIESPATGGVVARIEIPARAHPFSAHRA